MTLPIPRSAPRLPGVYVETVHPPRTDVLPRMDIAAFVGFAASGPLHRPVPVEDLARFRDIFGPDLILARDEAREENTQSLLGPAVEAFFANGGRRAFILRVADESSALTLDMPVPNLADATGAPAIARSRSPGLWPAIFASDTRLVRRQVFTSPGTGFSPSESLPEFELQLTPSVRPPVQGDLLELTFNDAGLLAFAVVDRIDNGRVFVREGSVFWRAAATSPPQGAIGADDDLVSVEADNPGVTSLISDANARIPSSVSILTFDLILWNGTRIYSRMNDLGFAPEHPRYWAALPDDEALFGEIFGRPARRQSPEEARFEADASAPRFALAGPVMTTAPVWLPNAMKTFEDQSRAIAPDVPNTARLESEGLSTLTDALFLDDRFARLSTDALGPEMEARYAMELGADAAPLRGLHALYPIGEIAMLCVPDAVHKRWDRRLDTAGAPLDAPFLAPIPRTLDAFDRLDLSWTSVSGAESYRIELAPNQDFTAVLGVTVAEANAQVPFSTECPETVAVRVRAERPGEIGPWSNVRASLVPEEDFEACAYTDPDLLTLRLTLDAEVSPGPVLSWAFEPPGALEPEDRFELQSGAAPSLADAETIIETFGEQEYFPDPVLGGPVYMRVRVLRGDGRGPWSNTVRLDPTGQSDFTATPDAEFNAPSADDGLSGQSILTAIHRSMIRFAAAKADLVTLLSLPRHFEEREVEAHLARLSPFIDDIDGTDDAPSGALLVPGLRIGEEGALSYAALYHPWFSTLNATSPVFQPPDGAAAGLISRQANGPGVWIASANLPIEGAVALTPRFDDDVQARLIADQINPLRRDPRGFLAFNAETLSSEDGLRPLPVRLLMILLRRLAFREGNAYVFEPHSADFRAQVRRRFERLLSIIHERGGFAGTTPAQSFTVRAGEDINPPSAVDRGRFSVELRVAPSRPFRYLNVRLLRTGTERISVEEGL